MRMIFTIVLALTWIGWGLAQRTGYWVYALLVKRQKVADTPQNEGQVVGLTGFGVTFSLMVISPWICAVYWGLRGDAGRFVLCYEIGLSLIALIMLTNAGIIGLAKNMIESKRKSPTK
jgi:hypothetical protein